jgi:hypothetical protein
VEIFNRHTEERGAPRLSDAIATVGSVAAGVGILMISADIFDSSPGRPAPVALFAALVLAGYAVLLWAPASVRPAGITAVVVGILGALGWWWLPGASSMADVRPFLLLTIVAMVVCFVVPRSRGRAIFVVIVLLVLWLWAIAEIASPEEAYSIAPIPSPPAHTVLSLSGFQAQVTLEDLDINDPLYPLAEDCEFGDMTACDDLYAQADFGSDFSEFGGTCGDTFSGSPGFCAQSGTPPSFDFDDDVPSPFFPSDPGLVTGDDKSFEIGFVSVLFGLVYLGALFVLDQRRLRGLATAFVLPALAALIEGTSLLGNAAGHAWVGGLLTLVAGVLIGAVGHVAGARRFTTWTGGLLIALGALTIALDVANIDSTTSDDGNLKIAGPGMIVVGVGIALVAFAFLAAQWLPDPDPGPEADEPELGDPLLGGGPPPPGTGGGWATSQLDASVPPPPPQSWNAPPTTAVPAHQWGAPSSPPPPEPPPASAPPRDYGWGPPPAEPPARE